MGSHEQISCPQFHNKCFLLYENELEEQSWIKTTLIMYQTLYYVIHMYQLILSSWKPHEIEGVVPALQNGKLIHREVNDWPDLLVNGRKDATKYRNADEKGLRCNPTKGDRWCICCTYSDLRCHEAWGQVAGLPQPLLLERPSQCPLEQGGWGRGCRQLLMQLKWVPSHVTWNWLKRRRDQPWSWPSMFHSQLVYSPIQQFQ